jgi:hypothetical protein
MGAKVDRIVQEAQQALADGNCVVVGLQSTGASGTESFIDSGLWNTESMISTAAAFLHNVVCCRPVLTLGFVCSRKILMPAPTDPQDVQGRR